MKLREILSAARIELLEPRPQKPSYRQLLHWAVGILQSIQNRLTSSGQAWVIGETTIEVQDGESAYVVNPQGGPIGRIIDVTSNYDPDNGEYEYQLPFSDFTDMAEGWQEGWGAGTERVAFYRKHGDPNLYARFRPRPSASETFRVAYTVAGTADTALDESPILEHHHHLIIAKLALRALPAASWSEDENENRTKRAELRSYLEGHVAEYERDLKFDMMISVPRNNYRLEAFPIE
ncbi:MAG TPA: hypothetical protein VN256_13200 [Pyrinomonadaceae bacterium]|nr:hypothetical protein [Pyrinomonadaceae bacterium]